MHECTLADEWDPNPQAPVSRVVHCRCRAPGRALLD